MQHSQHCLHIQQPWLLPAWAWPQLLVLLQIPPHLHLHPSKIVAKVKASRISKTVCSGGPERDIHKKVIDVKWHSFYRSEIPLFKQSNSPNTRKKKYQNSRSNQFKSCNSHLVALQLLINNQMNLEEWLLNNNMQHSQLQYISGFCSLSCCRLCHRWLRRSFWCFVLFIRGILVIFITVAKV